MGERDQVWEHEENLFLRFKYMYYVKEFRGDRATRLKEHLTEKMRMFHGAPNVHRTYRTTFNVSCKGSKSEIRL
jgi:hypothetical protein